VYIVDDKGQLLRIETLCAAVVLSALPHLKKMYSSFQMREIDDKIIEFLVRERV
jgi:hypothetical protein